MSVYTVYFQLLGKKMKTSVTANSASEAQQKVIDALKFDKTVKEPTDNELVKTFMDILNIIK